jgi:hypothetical protein
MKLTDELTDESIADLIDEEIQDTDYDEEYSNFRLFGIGKETEGQKKRKAKRKEKFNKIKEKLNNTKIGKFVGDKLGGGVAVHAVNKFNPAFIATRGAALSILNNNVVGMADAMSIAKEDKPNWEEILQKWWMWGGDKSKFDKAVSKGKGKKPLFKDVIQKLNKKKGFDGAYSYANADTQKKEKAADVVILASTLIGVTGAALATGGVIVAPYVTGGAVVFGTMAKILKKVAKNKGATDEELNEIPEATDLPNAEQPKDAKELERINKEIEANLKAGIEDDGLERKSGKILGIPKTAFWIGIGALTLISGFFIYKNIKK